jgi:hypothetical protein
MSRGIIQFDIRLAAANVFQLGHQQNVEVPFYKGHVDDVMTFLHPCSIPGS